MRGLREAGGLAPSASSLGLEGSLSSFLSLSLLCIFVAVLSTCKPSEDSRIIALAGAVLIDGTGGPPQSNSVILIAETRVRAVGTLGGIPLPAAAQKVNGSGRFVVPAPVDVETAAAANIVEAANAEAARQQVDRAASRHPDILIAGKLAPPAAEAVLDQARKHRIPVLVRISSLAEVRFLVDNGAAGFLGMIENTTDLDPALVSRLRDLRTVFVPELARLSAAALETAKRNTARLAAGGVLIAVGSAGGAMTQREMEMLADAGLPPGDVLVAATRNGALAIGKSAEIGTIQPGRRADLLILSANPLEDIRNMAKVERAMRNGEWVEGR